MGCYPRHGGGSGKLGLCAALVLFLLPFVVSAPAVADNPVQVENAQPGDSAWTAALQDPLGPNPPIDGYASATGVRPGATISFQVSTTPAARYRVEITRLGWYGGSGGRRITCLVGLQLDPSCSQDHMGVEQPAASAPDPVTRETRARWSATDTLVVPSGWVSGYYLAVFRLTSGPSAGETGFAPFIVQAPAGDHSAILIQVPSNTWQAYNPWGGLSFYTKPTRAVKVSFDRPYAHRLLFDWEYPLVRFLERGGWDVSYATDDDVDADPSILLGHQLDMVAGHDEYWTKVMRDAWEAARAGGVNLAFMGANTGFWQVRYEDARRTLVGYKYFPDPYPDPSDWTTQFRNLNPPRPECELFGVQFEGDVLLHQNWDLVADPAVAHDPWFAGTGLTPGSILAGLGGSETDSIVPGCHVPPVTPLLSYSGPPFPNGTPAAQDTVRYTACSGAEVFSAGSLQFSWGLDSWRDASYLGPGLPALPPANGGLEQAMTNALADLTRSHVPVPGPPRVCVPNVRISAPVAWAAVGQGITFQTASTDPYGQISGQRWLISLGRRSATATSPQVAHTFWRAGVAHVRLLVTDSSGANADAVRTLHVCPCPDRAPTQGSQQGSPCEVMAIGSVRRINQGLSFAPFPRITPSSLTGYRIMVAAGRIRLVSLGSDERVRTAMALLAVRGPMVVEFTAGIAGHVQHQKFLVPYSPTGHFGRPQRLTEALCDGTAAQMITPAFRGPRSVPLRVAVSGRGALIVSLTGPDGRTLTSRRTSRDGRTVVMAFNSSRLPRGIYHVTVTLGRTRLPQPIRLAALAL
jgi:hypothetical protein